MSENLEVNILAQKLIAKDNRPLCMLENFSCVFVACQFFRKKFWNKIRMSDLLLFFNQKKMLSKSM